MRHYARLCLDRNSVSNCFLLYFITFLDIKNEILRLQLAGATPQPFSLSLTKGHVDNNFAQPGPMVRAQGLQVHLGGLFPESYAP
jgi:hypothetical protein